MSKSKLALVPGLTMNRTPSPHPSPPMGERVPEGRVRGIRPGSWPLRAQGLRWSLALFAAALAASAIAAFGQEPTPLLTQPADKLVAILKSPASQKEKADACRQLAVIGTKDAVPALVALLGDEKLSHMARYALETIPDPSVDKALRDCLDKLKGRPLVGVIGSLGVRRDAKAVKPLAGLLRNADAEAAQGAARALGTIGNAAAAKALRRALGGVAAANQLACCEGLLRCAEALSAKGQRKEALGIYDQLRGLQTAPHQVRTAALRGAILGRDKAGVELLREQLRSQDYLLFAAAVRTSQELPGAEVTLALASGLGQLPVDNQIVVIQTLAQRADRAALPALLPIAKSGAKPLRLAALRALAGIGDAAALPVLTESLADADSEVAQTARESLASLSGPEADAAVVAMLGSNDPARRLSAIELIGRRRMTSCISALLKATADADLRPSALKALGQLGSPADLPALLDVLSQLKEPADLEAAEQAVTAVCAKAGDPEPCVEKLAGAWSSAQPAQKSPLLRVLTSIGSASALMVVRTAVTESSPEVRAAAIRALGAWKTADAAPYLFAVAGATSDSTERTICLRSLLGMAANPDFPAEQRLGMCRQAATLITQSEEKKLLLAALGSIPSAESLELVTPHLDDAAIKDEACAAAVAIAEQLLKGQNAAQVAAKLIEPLQKAAEATANADLASRAKRLLQQAQSKAGGK